MGKLIKTGKILFPDPIKHKIDMTEELKDFISRLLERDPSKRLGVNGVKEVKNHKWFDGFDFTKLMKKLLDAPFIPLDKLVP